MRSFQVVSSGIRSFKVTSKKVLSNIVKGASAGLVWLLATGFWNDDGVWDDDSTWND